MKTITWLISFFFVASAALAVSEGPTEEKDRIGVILLNVKLTSDFSGEARVTANHEMLLRHAVTFELPEGNKETYLIHSPIRLFGAKPNIGQKYIISRTLEKEQGIWKLEVYSPMQTKGANQVEHSTR